MVVLAVFPLNDIFFGTRCSLDAVDTDPDSIKSVSKQIEREISILNQKGGMLNIHGRYNPLVHCVHMRGESE